MTEKLYGARKRPTAVVAGIAAGLALLSQTACESGDQTLPSDCTSKIQIHGMYPRKTGQEQAVEITVSKPADPTTFKGYVFGYELPDDKSGDWHASDLQQSKDEYNEATYVVKLGKEAAALAVWKQAADGGADCKSKPIVDWGDAVPPNQIKDELPVVTWNMADTIG
jgi:hypothetical protein